MLGAYCYEITCIFDGLRHHERLGCPASDSSMACSTVIVGKDASATGQVIVGHNEDNGGRSLSIPNTMYRLPSTKPVTMIKYEPTAAMIPASARNLGLLLVSNARPERRLLL